MLLLLPRYTTKVQKELELDERALSNLQADKQRFLCKAVENYIQCLGEGEEHDTWVFRLASLWLENGDVAAVNAMMTVSSCSLTCLQRPLMAGGGIKALPVCCSSERREDDPLLQVSASDVSARRSDGVEDGVWTGRGQGLPQCPLQCERRTVFLHQSRTCWLTCPSPSQLMCRACLEHPHHTLFIIFALVNANKDKAFCKTPASKDVPGQPSPLDLVRTS